MKTETIAAIATGMSNSGIGIVRISGDQAFEVIDRIYRNKKGQIFSEGSSAPFLQTKLKRKEIPLWTYL